MGDQDSAVKNLRRGLRPDGEFPPGRRRREGAAAGGTHASLEAMDQLPLWITPALVLGLFAWVWFMFRDLKENVIARMSELKTDTTKRIDELKIEMKSQFAAMNQRVDQVNRELAGNRERMAKLEGSLDGFLAGRRDLNAA